MRALLLLLLICVFGGVVLLVERTGERRARGIQRAGEHPATAVRQLPDSLDVRAAIRSLSSPALEERKARRLALQRAGYASVLSDVLRRDGTGAFLSLVRLNAQVSYAISHRPIEVYIPIESPPDSALGAARFFSFSVTRSPPFRVELHDNWTMPEDPWR